MMYYLRVLGGVSLEDSSEVVSSSAAQQRPLAVLAILAVAREQGCSRDKLVGYLWPESDQERARHRLADIVHLVRKSLGDATILSSGATLRLNRQLVESDVAAFLDALDAGNLESAVEHYGGPLLDGFYLSGLPEFERWMESERQRLGDEFSDALQALAAASGTSGDHIAAAKWWKRLLAHDPYNSRFATGLMEALARSGDPANALQYAQEHERLLRDELGMEPDPRLAALAERLKREPVTVTEGDRAITADSMPVPLEGARTEPVRGRRFLTFRNAGLRLLAVLAVFGIVAVGWMMLGDGAPLDAPKSAAVLPLDNDTEALAEAGPGIAVLPFRVHGDGLELWREGMVDLLSTDMNGVGGLRAIDSRTLLARWREKLPETGDPDRETALQVAQASGARYALLGSAIGIGPAVRLSADIYDTEGGAQLGSVQVEGAPDSVLALVDRLAVQALLVALEREASELPPVDLASVTTASIPALTAWLEAEALHRHGDIPAAMAAYERAVAADSTFALAFHGLSLAYGWFEGGDRIASASELALRWVDRLPAREAALVRGTNAWLQGELSEADEILQRLVRTHPDYAMAWYALGELYYHTGTVIPVSVDDAGRCFTRAVELDPQFAPFRLHIIDMAFELEPDSAIAARLITDYKRLASANAVHTRLVEVAFDLVFADQAHRQRALASLDTLDPIILQGLPGNPPLTHPRFWPYFEAVLLARQERGIRPGNTTTFLFRGGGPTMPER
jgi:DNA-binding SARP family transcriptional activator/TolB-like protein